MSEIPKIQSQRVIIFLSLKQEKKMRKKIVLLSLMALSTLSFATDNSVYRVKSGMLACYEKSIATDAFAIILATQDPQRPQRIQKLLSEGKCIMLGQNDLFKILEKHSKSLNGLSLDYLKIKKIKDHNKEAQKLIDDIRKNGTAKAKKELDQILTGWVKDIRKDGKSFMYEKVK